MEDNLKSLFEAIRRQDAVLWVGAGFSRYAGYKSGEDLAKQFYEEIAKEDRESIDESRLQDVTHALKYLYKEKGKQKIIDILTTEFIDKKAESQEYHDILSKIPHVTTVITTNYDRLLELSYKEKAHLIYHDNHITTKDKNKIEIFKIHGDLADPESIIITTEDYDRFFLKGKESNIWTVVAERITSNVQVFLGYGFEDRNVVNIFYKIWDNIDVKKTCYLVAPNLKRAQIAKLDDMGIIYIDLSGEKFIDELYQNIEQNILPDLNANWIGIDIFSKFMSTHKIGTVIESSNDKFKIKSFYSTDENGALNAHINFTINNKDSANDLTDFLTGQILNEVTVPIENFSLNANGILLAKTDSDTETIFVFQRNPIEYVVDVRFKETSFERNNISVQFFISESNAECIADLKQGKLIVKMKNEDPAPLAYHVKAEHNSQFGKINDVIEYFTFLLYIFNGTEFTIYLDNKAVHNKKLSKDQTLTSAVEFYLQYFKSLKRIENYFDIQFGSFDSNSINKESTGIVNNLITLIDNKPIEYVFDKEIYFNLKDVDVDFANRLINGQKGDDISLVKQYLKEEIITLHGKSITLGYKEERYMSMYPTNLKHISSDSPYMTMKSHTETIEVIYHKELPKEEENTDDLPTIEISINPIEQTNP